MGGITDAQNARAGPIGKSINGDGQQAHVIPVADLIEAVSQERRQLCDLLPERVDAFASDAIGLTLGNDKGGLPVSVAIEQHQDPASIEVAERLMVVAR